jgi:hypothetical protein
MYSASTPVVEADKEQEPEKRCCDVLDLKIDAVLVGCYELVY